MTPANEIISIIKSYPMLITLADAARMLNGTPFQKQGEKTAVSTKLARALLRDAGVEPVVKRTAVMRTDRSTHLPVVVERPRYLRGDVARAFFKI